MPELPDCDELVVGFCDINMLSRLEATLALLCGLVIGALLAVGDDGVAPDPDGVAPDVAGAAIAVDDAPG